MAILPLRWRIYRPAALFQPWIKFHCCSSEEALPPVWPPSTYFHKSDLSDPSEIKLITPLLKTSTVSGIKSIAESSRIFVTGPFSHSSLLSCHSLLSHLGPGPLWATRNCSQKSQLVTSLKSLWLLVLPGKFLRCLSPASLPSSAGQLIDRSDFRCLFLQEAMRRSWVFLPCTYLPSPRTSHPDVNPLLVSLFWDTSSQGGEPCLSCFRCVFRPWPDATGSTKNWNLLGTLPCQELCVLTYCSYLQKYVY